MATKERFVGVSFDDGPNSQNIQEILAILRENNCQATFFWIAEFAKKFSDQDRNLFSKIIRELKVSEHEIGLHAPSDYAPTFLSRAYSQFSKEEIKIAIADLEELTGQKVRLYRPHYLLQPASIIFARQLGLSTVFGDAIHYASADASTEVQIKKFSGARSGSILIFHDGTTLQRKTTHILEVLPQVLDNLKGLGLTPTKASAVLS